MVEYDDIYLIFLVKKELLNHDPEPNSECRSRCTALLHDESISYVFQVFQIRIRPDPKSYGLKDPDPELLISDPDLALDPLLFAP